MSNQPYQQFVGRHTNDHLVFWVECDNCGLPTPIPSLMSYIYGMCESCRRGQVEKYQAEIQQLMERNASLESQNYALHALLDIEEEENQQG